MASCCVESVNEGTRLNTENRVATREIMNLSQLYRCLCRTYTVSEPRKKKPWVGRQVSLIIIFFPYGRRASSLARGYQRSVSMPNESDCTQRETLRTLIMDTRARDRTMLRKKIYNFRHYYFYHLNSRSLGFTNGLIAGIARE